LETRIDRNTEKEKHGMEVCTVWNRGRREQYIYIDVASIEIWFESNYFLVNVKLAA
jgi:hypothetical protein